MLSARPHFPRGDRTVFREDGETLRFRRITLCPDGGDEVSVELSPYDLNRGRITLEIFRGKIASETRSYRKAERCR